MVTLSVTNSFDVRHGWRYKSGMPAEHPLVEYAKKAGVTITAIAERASCSRMQLYRVMNGENTTISLLERISAATDGKVPVSAILREAATQ